MTLLQAMHACIYAMHGYMYICAGVYVIVIFWHHPVVAIHRSAFDLHAHPVISGVRLQFFLYWKIFDNIGVPRPYAICAVRPPHSIWQLELRRNAIE